jgi:hypothetical protein
MRASKILIIERIRNRTAFLTMRYTFTTENSTNRNSSKIERTAYLFWLAGFHHVHHRLQSSSHRKHVGRPVRIRRHIVDVLGVWLGIKSVTHNIAESIRYSRRPSNSSSVPSSIIGPMILFGWPT